MKLPEKQDSKFENPPAGNHLAVCYAVIDLGTQVTKFGPKRQIRIQWELPHETMDDGRPHVIGQTYTFSSNEKANLLRDLESWRGRKFSDEEYGQFEIFDVIGAGCFLNCVQNGDYVNVDTVAALPKGTAPPPMTCERITFDFDNPSTSDLDRISEYWRGKIAESPEYQQLGKDAKPRPPENQEPVLSGGHYPDDTNDTPF